MNRGLQDKYSENMRFMMVGAPTSIATMLKRERGVGVCVAMQILVLRTICVGVRPRVGCFECREMATFFESGSEKIGCFAASCALLPREKSSLETAYEL